LASAPRYTGPRGMEYSRNQIAIAAGAGVLLVLIFFGYLIW